MTNEEIERALDFLVKSQAAFEVRQAAFEQRQAAFEQRQAAFEKRIEETNQQIAETGRQIQVYAETQTEFIEIVVRNIEAQNQANASLRASIREGDASLRAAISEVNDSLRTSISELNDSLRTSISDLATTQARTDARLDRLAAIVERSNKGDSDSN